MRVGVVFACTPDNRFWDVVWDHGVDLLHRFIFAMKDALAPVLGQDLDEVGLGCVIFLDHIDSPGEGVVPIAVPVAGC